MSVSRVMVALAAGVVAGCAATGESTSVEIERRPGALERVNGALSNGREHVGAAVGAGRQVIGRSLETFERPEDRLVADPFEPVNRIVYRFNDLVDRVALGPLSEAYRAVIPQAGRNRVRDFVDNLKTPVWFANEVLQGDWEGAGTQAARFTLNTTVGVAGLYDFAYHVADLPKHDEDFGQTLAVWGLGNGPYIMLPLLGPSTGRDLVGRIGDYGMDPLTWAEFEGDDALLVTRNVLDVVDIRERTDEVVDLVREGVDPYVQARALYIQSRDRRIREDESRYEDLPDFEDEEDFEDLPDFE